MSKIINKKPFLIFKCNFQLVFSFSSEKSNTISSREKYLNYMICGLFR